MLPELLEEEFEPEEVERVLLLAPGDIDIGGIRMLAIRIKQIEHQRAKNAAIKAAVVATYDERDATLADQEERAKRRLEEAIGIVGKVRMPDVGTVYLQNVSAKVEVADAVKANAYARLNGYMKTPPDVVDITTMKQSFFDQGEIPPEETGLVWVKETKALRIRK